MDINLAIAPCSWGIEDAGNPANPPWERVLDEAAEAGYKGVELGPYGYLPQEGPRVAQELDKRGLSLMAGTLYDDLLSPDNLKNIVEKTAVTCRILSEIRKENEPMYLVVIDAVNDVRNTTAGRPGDAVRLDSEKWGVMVSHIREVSRVADSYGIRPVIHPHAGGYLEFDDEIERFVNEFSSDVAGLCLDTGHLTYACDDPAASLRKYGSRLDYVHFKDIDRLVYENAVSRGQGFFDACLEGVMCSIGRGCVDYSTVFDTLKDLDYRGWITIEQERDPRDTAGVLSDISESRKFLEKKKRANV